MRIFLALLLALLIADTITARGNRPKNPKGDSWRSAKVSRSRGDYGTHRGRRPSSSNPILKKLQNLAQSEKQRDESIEAKLDQAVAQIQDMSGQVSKLEATVWGAIELNQEKMQSQTDADHSDVGSGSGDDYNSLTILNSLGNFYQ